jgi:hypothetical protein
VVAHPGAGSRPGGARRARAGPCAGASLPRHLDRKEESIRHVAIVARLKSGTEQEAADLLAQGPPFDPAERGLDRHVVYLSADEVVFVFEGPEVDVVLDDLIESPFEPRVASALERWRPLIEGNPRIARPAYEWLREES